MLRNSIYLLVAGAALSSLACTEEDPNDPVTPMPSASNTTVGPASVAPMNSGPGPAPAECGGNLLAGDLGEMGNWVGGDAAMTDDNPCGIQGALYAYGDADQAQAAGLTPSCVIPDPLDCSSGECCLSGSTIIDDTFAAWGCGIGLTLNDDGDMTTEKMPYMAAMTGGFSYTITGSLTPGQYIRVSYTQPGADEGACSPFQGGTTWTGSPITPAALEAGPFTGEVRFTDVVCPSGAEADCGCMVPVATPLDLQVQVTGGEAEGPFEFCITNLTPLAP